MFANKKHGPKTKNIQEELDLSHNSLGSYGARIIRTALMERSLLQAQPLAIEAPSDAETAATTTTTTTAATTATANATNNNIGSLKKLSLKDEDTPKKRRSKRSQSSQSQSSQFSTDDTNQTSSTSPLRGGTKNKQNKRKKSKKNRKNVSKTTSSKNADLTNENENIITGANSTHSSSSKLKQTSSTSSSSSRSSKSGIKTSKSDNKDGNESNSLLFGSKSQGAGSSSSSASLLNVDSYIWALPGKMRNKLIPAVANEFEQINLISPWMSVENYRKMEEKLQVWINFEGNFMKEEVFNSVTHGLGILLSVLGGFILLHNASYHSWRCYVSCAIYCFTLFFMYLSSTLYHSFSAMPLVRPVLRVLDYSSVFMLIAGTYTPILVTGLSHSSFHSYVLFTMMWVCAFSGVTLSAWIGNPTGSMWKTMILLYVSMSYVFLIAIKPFVTVFDTNALVWILVGGACYTGGIYFLQQDEMNPILHSVWHMFVLAGSICHYLAILLYVVPMDAVDREYEPLTWQTIINGFLMDFPVTQWVGDLIGYLTE